MHKYSTSKKILLGIASFSPTLYLLLITGSSFFNTSKFFISESADKFFLFLGWGMSFFYIFNNINLELIPNDKKGKKYKNISIKFERKKWLIILVIGGAIVLPFYWYLNVWKEPQNPIV